MRTFNLVIVAILFVGISMANAAAAISPAGLWRNDRENITVRIVSTNGGIKAMRTDQGVWYTYAKEGNRYTDRKGNYYELQGNDEILWREPANGKRILFERVNGDDRTTSREADPDWQRDDDVVYGDGRRDDDRRGDDDWYDDRDNRRHDDGDHDRYDDRNNRSRFSSLNGEWFSQNGRRTIDIHTEQNGLRVYREDGRGMLFAPTRDSKVFKSRRGDTISWLNANTLQLKTNDRHNFIFHRGGNGEIRGNGHGHDKHHGNGNGKAKGHYKKS